MVLTDKIQLSVYPTIDCIYLRYEYMWELKAKVNIKGIKYLSYLQW